MNDAISAYAQALDPQRAAICDRLRPLIDAALPSATSKVWEGVRLMFWNGQRFDEPELTPSGSFHVAQIDYDDAAQIDAAKLAGWLQKAGTNIWDMVGERNAFVAKRRAAKSRVKAKSKAKKVMKALPRKATSKKKKSARKK